jgi:lipopolysaccharide transport system ATP-binding protein
MSVVIKVEHLSKTYFIRHQAKESYATIRDVVAERAKKIFSSVSKLNSSKASEFKKKETFWALKDINLEINQGDRIGVIGRNGAGKSTLLKVLSRITEPSDGRVSIKGRIASLLEVGTGFHPELSGRENIYLNGAILGMHRSEIKRKFEEIVAFSGVEKFLDTPVKRYSSGMYVRLAFAVAAHLESEILIVDEVLAVGDTEFQKKCLGKMQDVSQREGRTVLFVSHNMQVVNNLCSKVILLDNGRIIQHDETTKVIRNYLMFETSKSAIIEWPIENALGDSNIKLNAVRVLDSENKLRNHFFSSSTIRIQMDFEVYKLDDLLVIGFDLTNEEGTVIFRTYHNDSRQEEWPLLEIGRNSIYCDIPGKLLREGTYYISPKISLHAKKWIVDSDPLLSFDVELDHGVSPFWNFYNKTNRPGILSKIFLWKK